MKYAFLFSGALGFVVVGLAGFSADRQFDFVLRDAAIGCLIMAFAGRWFWRVFERAFADTIHARRAAAEAAAARAEDPVPPPPAVSPAKTPPARPTAASKPAPASR